MRLLALLQLQLLCSGQTTAPSASPAPVPTCAVSRLIGNGSTGYSEGTGGGAAVFQPVGLAFALDGVTLYLADQQNNRIRAISPALVTSTLAGTGVKALANADGPAATVQLCFPSGLVTDSAGGIVFSELAPSHRIRRLHGGAVTTVAGNGVAAWADSAVGTAASFFKPYGLAISPSDTVYVADTSNNRIRVVTPAGAVTTLAGGVSTTLTDGVGSSASFLGPSAVAWADGTVYVADSGHNAIRAVATATAVTVLLAGGGSAGWADGWGTAAQFSNPRGIAWSPAASQLLVVEYTGALVRAVTPMGAVTTLAGNGSLATADGTGTAGAAFYYPLFPAARCDGSVLVTEAAYVRALNCSPSAALPACPGGSIRSPGALCCTPCPAGTLPKAPSATACQPCPGGHACPAGTASWALLNCGRGSYCPEGSGAPRQCPLQAPPAAGWGALQAQGPAFLVDTATCLSHCFWNFTSGSGALSTC